VVKLELPNNNLVGTLPESIGYLTALEYCDLQGNKLTGTIPASINQCTQLTWLDCSENQLSTLDVSNNPQLDILDCYTNQLSGLDIHSNTQLRRLDCCNNQLSSLDISNNTLLEWLACFDNKLPLSDLYAVSEQISNVHSKVLGTQRLPTQVAMTDIALFSSQVEFGGVPTRFYVEKGGVQADSALDYIINNGLIFKNTGNYTVTMTNGAIVSSTLPAKVIAEIFISGVNIPENTIKGIEIYPNPTSEYLHVNLAEQQTAEYNICNLMGQVVAHGTLQGEAVLNIASLAKGTYFLKIAGATVKIVKI
jgi:hypothetical protein